MGFLEILNYFLPRNSFRYCFGKNSILYTALGTFFIFTILFNNATTVDDMYRGRFGCIHEIVLHKRESYNDLKHYRSHEISRLSAKCVMLRRFNSTTSTVAKSTRMVKRSLSRKNRDFLWCIYERCSGFKW